MRMKIGLSIFWELFYPDLDVQSKRYLHRKLSLQAYQALQELIVENIPS